MKKTLLLIAVFIVNLAQGQTILIPNGGFDTNTAGWSITGTNMSISATGGRLSIGTAGNATNDFTLISSQFNLDASKAYKLHTEYRHVQFDPMMGEMPLGGFTDVYLKDITGTTVSTANINLNTCQVGGYLELCSSINFNVPSSGTYYIEFDGQYSQDMEFIIDNVGFEEVILNIFSGTVTLDVNNDGCATSSTTVENCSIQVNETNSNTSYNVITDANGDFTIASQNITGTFVTQANQALYNSTPANYSNTISSGINNITNQDFCILANTVANDLNINIIPTTQARPGFNTSYQIRYTNLGTTTLSGVVDFSFDNTKVTYLNASVAPTITASTLSWNYSNIMPFETRYIDVDFNVLAPPTVNNGDVLSYTASVTPVSGDYTPADNTFTFNQITIGSYDPNDITILEGPLISTSQASDYLNVLIRFQNTGTASAINVEVENTLDAFLDWNTFQPIAASHPYSAIVVSNGNDIDFVFNGINLPDETTDEPGSHGWISYKIKPKATFMQGDIISNTADIYFDYNLPIITNTATTQIDATLPIELIRFYSSEISKDHFYLNWETASELNNERFEIEESKDGKAFLKIGIVEGNGTTVVQQKYTFKVEAPPMGITYYRLKQVDDDAQFEYSEILSVNLKEEHQQFGAFYPNPSQSGMVNLDYTTQKDAPIIATVYDMTGKQIAVQLKAISAGKETLDFDFSALAKGIYVVHLNHAIHSIYRKLIID